MIVDDTSPFPTFRFIPSLLSLYFASFLHSLLTSNFHSFLYLCLSSFLPTFLLYNLYSFLSSVYLPTFLLFFLPFFRPSFQINSRWNLCLHHPSLFSRSPSFFCLSLCLLFLRLLFLNTRILGRHSLLQKDTHTGACTHTHIIIRTTIETHTHSTQHTHIQRRYIITVESLLKFIAQILVVFQRLK